MKSKILVLGSLGMLSAGFSILLVRFQFRLIDLIWGNAILGYLGVVLSVVVLFLALRHNAFKPYPLLRLCIVLWPGLGTLLASAVLLLQGYAQGSYVDEAFMASLVIVGFFIIQLVVFPFAAYQVLRNRR
ncbi:MAG: hypothetical protein ACE5JQ_07290 [Candidatus Methylomirabilales bacterium]